MKIDERKMAIEMRKLGFSLNEISKKLKISKGSASLWLRKFKLTNCQKDAIDKKTNMNRNLFIDKLKEDTINRHIEMQKSGYELAKTDEHFRILSSLYWAEGWKYKNSNSFDLANCDEEMIFGICKWLIDNNYKDKLRIKIRYYDENGISKKDVIKWWIEKIQLVNESKIKVYSQKIKRKSQKKGIGRRKYGVATIIVCDTNLIQKVYGGIEYVKTFLKT